MRGYEDIVRFDISMYNVSVVEVLEGKQDLADYQRGWLLVKGATIVSNKGEEVTACHKFGEHVPRMCVVGTMSRGVFDDLDAHCIIRPNDLLRCNDIWLSILSFTNSKATGIWKKTHMR